MTTTVVIIFALTWLLIAFRRLRVLPIGRPAGALLGATLMVVTGAMTPEASYHAIDGDTIVLLLGMMLITAELEQTGFFPWASARVLRVARTPRSLLTVVALASALGSAFLVNDTVCLFLTPIVVATCVAARLPLGPYLIVLATSANLGSALTLVGNPQNMLIGSMSGLGFAAFMLAALPAVAVAFMVHLCLAHRFYKRALPPALAQSAPGPVAVVDTRRVRVVMVVLVGVVIAFFLGAHLGYAAMSGAVALMVTRFREPQETFRRVDWTLLLFFCGLFVVTAALRDTGLVASAWEAAAPAMRLDSPGGLTVFTALMTLGSNLVSNVPMVVLTGPYLETLGDPSLGWVLMGFITTVAVVGQSARHRGGRGRARAPHARLH
ncbi:MAG TPA: SLC13 family permease [Myxococcota bacterium]|nr:SLC13 family permease [Myxococcota bacterium]